MARTQGKKLFSSSCDKNKTKEHIQYSIYPYILFFKIFYFGFTVEHVIDSDACSQKKRVAS